MIGDATGEPYERAQSWHEKGHSHAQGDILKRWIQFCYSFEAVR